MTKTNFTAAKAIAHVKRQFITSDINFEWLNRNQIKELIQQREIFDQKNANRSIKSVEDSVGLVKSHNLVAYVYDEIYLIDVVRTIGITSNGNIEESALQRALKKYQDLKNERYRKITKMRLPAIYTREPGGTKGAERIRKVILEDYFHKNSKEKFNKYTDTLLYLAARNEHIEKKLRPAISKIPHPRAREA